MKNNKIYVSVILILTISIFVFLKNYYQALPSKEQAPLSEASQLIKEHSPRLGPDAAKVKIVEFLDPECEACREMAPIIKKLMHEYDGKIQLIVRYMPFHGNSIKAATYLEEAREKGKYWQAMTVLFENQPAWANHHDPKPELIPKYLVHAGLKDAESFNENVLLSKHRWKVDLDFADGKILGVKYTPTFFVNGQMLQEIGYEPIKRAIDDELGKQ